MKRTHRICAATVLALACAGGIYATWRGTSARSATTAAETEGARVRWPAGTELRYRVSWQTSSAVHVMPGSGMEGRLDTGGASALEGTLVLKVVRAHDHEATLLASFADLETARFTVGAGADAKTVPDDTARAALVGPSAVLEVDDQGRLTEMRAPKDANAMFGDVMHALATELSFELAKDDVMAWTTEERTMTGVARNAYRIEKKGDGTQIERRRDGYTKLHAVRSLHEHTPTAQGTTRIELDKDGAPSSFDAEEEVLLEVRGQNLLESKTKLALTLASRAPFAFAGEEEIASFQVHTPGGSLDPRAADRNLVGKFASEDMAALVAGYAASGSFRRGELARAAAYLRLHPEECKTLERTFERETSTKGKNIVFDILTSAGSPEAQAAMRRLLDSPTAKASAPLHRMLVQRLALLSEPTSESVGFLRDLERKASTSGDSALANAALVSRGAALARRMAGGDAAAEAEAREMLSRARGDLSEMPAKDRSALIKAVGNLQHPDAADALAGHAKDADVEVRASVATALRHSSAPRASRVLFDMMSDADPYVAKSALDSHLGRRLDAKELDAFAAHVRASGTNAQTDNALGTAILQHASTNPAAVRSVLETLLGRVPEDSEEAAHLKAALADLPA